MKRSYGYHSYHGRGRGRAARITLIIIAVLLLLLILTFLFLSRYPCLYRQRRAIGSAVFEEQEPQTPGGPGPWWWKAQSRLTMWQSPLKPIGRCCCHRRFDRRHGGGIVGGSGG